MVDSPGLGGGRKTQSSSGSATLSKPERGLFSLEMIVGSVGRGSASETEQFGLEIDGSWVPLSCCNSDSRSCIRHSACSSLTWVAFKVDSSSSMWDLTRAR